MKRRVISFHYTLKDDAGNVLDASNKSSPLAFIEGGQQIIPGLEKGLSGLKKGEKKKIIVPPEAGYGQYDKRFIITVGREKLPEGTIQIGDQLQVGKEGDSQIVVVTKVEGDQVTLDGNHPLAGQNLNFDVEVMEAREATPEEIQHGHAHGPGGPH